MLLNWRAYVRGERTQRLVELSAIVERLACVIDPSYIPVWLHDPVPSALASRINRAIEHGNLLVAETTAREIGRVSHSSSRSR